MIQQPATDLNSPLPFSGDDPLAVVARWLAGIFAAPLSLESIESLETGADAAMLDYLDEQPAYRPGVAAIRAALLTPSAPDERQNRLQREYTLLFEGPGGPNTVPLYASAYFNERGCLFQEATADMEELLRRHDLSVAGSREPADHLAIELAVFAYLRSLGEVGRADAAKLDRHLVTWSATFTRLCAEKDRTGFYAGASLLLDALLAGGPADEVRQSTTRHFESVAN